MDKIDVYYRNWLTANTGVVVDDDGACFLQSGKMLTPLIIRLKEQDVVTDYPVVLPTDKHRRLGEQANTIRFHPLCESVLRGISPVHTRLIGLVTAELIGRFVKTVNHVLTFLSDANAAKNMSDGLFRLVDSFGVINGKKTHKELISLWANIISNSSGLTGSTYVLRANTVPLNPTAGKRVREPLISAATEIAMAEAPGNRITTLSSALYREALAVQNGKADTIFGVKHKHIAYMANIIVAMLQPQHCFGTADGTVAPAFLSLNNMISNFGSYLANIGAQLKQSGYSDYDVRTSVFSISADEADKLAKSLTTRYRGNVGDVDIAQNEPEAPTSITLPSGAVDDTPPWEESKKTVTIKRAATPSKSKVQQDVVIIQQPAPSKPAEPAKVAKPAPQPTKEVASKSSGFDIASFRKAAEGNMDLGNQFEPKPEVVEVSSFEKAIAAKKPSPVSTSGNVKVGATKSNDSVVIIASKSEEEATPVAPAKVKQTVQAPQSGPVRIKPKQSEAKPMAITIKAQSEAMVQMVDSYGEPLFLETGYPWMVTRRELNEVNKNFFTWEQDPATGSPLWNDDGTPSLVLLSDDEKNALCYERRQMGGNRQPQQRQPYGIQPQGNMASRMNGGYNQGGYNQGGYNQGGYQQPQNHGGYNHGGYQPQQHQPQPQRRSMANAMGINGNGQPNNDSASIAQRMAQAAQGNYIPGQGFHNEQPQHQPQNYGGHAPIRRGY